MLDLIIIAILFAFFSWIFNKRRSSRKIRNDIRRPTVNQSNQSSISQKNKLLDGLHITGSVLNFKLIFVLVMGITILGAILLHNASQKTIEEHLIANEWCIGKMTYDGTAVDLHTKGITLMIRGCKESMGFESNNHLKLPGINTEKVTASWNFRNDHIYIYQAPISHIPFNGKYRYRWERKQVILESDRTIIVLYQNNII